MCSPQSLDHAAGVAASGNAEEKLANALREVSKGAKTSDRRKRSEVLGKSVSDLADEWYHGAILALICMQGFREDVRWIAKRLGITAPKVKRGLERLGNAGLVRRTRQGRLVPIVRSPICPDISDKKIARRSFLDFTRFAVRFLRNDPEQESFALTMCFAVDPERLPEAYQMLQSYSERLSKRLGNGANCEVYRLGVGLFPVQKREP